MILICPKCLRKAKIEDEKIPKSGAWVLCPKCSEKFFIPAVNINRLLNDAAPTTGAPLGSLAPPVTLKLKASKSSPTSVEEPNQYILTEVPAQPFFKKYIVPTLLSLGCIALLVGIIFTYNLSTQNNIVEQLPPPAEVRHVEYGFEDLQKDILALKRKSSRFNRLNRLVDFRGTESRVLKYLQQHMQTNTCEEIVSLDFESEAPYEGFTLRANCLAPRDKGAVFRLKYVGGWVSVNEEVSDKSLDVPLMPSALQQWNVGQRVASALPLEEDFQSATASDQQAGALSQDVLEE
jgi:hypothetical protein